ncbi:hypothetical protein ACJX0J_025131, partial [Zea mays]
MAYKGDNNVWSACCKSFFYKPNKTEKHKKKVGKRIITAAVLGRMKPCDMTQIAIGYHGFAYLSRICLACLPTEICVSTF